MYALVSQVTKNGKYNRQSIVRPWNLITCILFISKIYLSHTYRINGALARSTVLDIKKSTMAKNCPVFQRFLAVVYSVAFDVWAVE